MARNYHVFDLIILGSGPAGRAALLEALKFTTNVVLVSPQESGFQRGACEHLLFTLLWRKALATRQMQETDVAEVSNAFSAELLRLRLNAAENFRPYLHYCVRGGGKFASPSSLRVDGRLLHFSSAILATGAEGEKAENAEEWVHLLRQEQPVVLDAHTHTACSFGVLLAGLGKEVEIRYPKSRYGISRESFAKWQALLPSSCVAKAGLPAEKTLVAALPSGLGLRAAGISKAQWQERNPSIFRLGDSRIFVAGTVGGSGKDAFASAEEGRQAVWEALGQPALRADSVTPPQHFTLYGMSKLAVFGFPLQALEKEAMTEQVLQTPHFAGGEGDIYVRLWRSITTGIPLRVEVIAFEPYSAIAYVKEWMRTGHAPTVAGDAQLETLFRPFSETIS